MRKRFTLAAGAAFVALLIASISISQSETAAPIATADDPDPVVTIRPRPTTTAPPVSAVPSTTAPPAFTGPPLVGIEREAPDSNPRLYSVTPSRDFVTIKWNDSSTNERQFIVWRRDANGSWVAARTIPSANPAGYGSYSWIDSIRGLGLQCYMVSAVADLKASTAEKCVVRPDPAVFPQWPSSVPSRALDWYGLPSKPDQGPRSLHNRTRQLNLRYGSQTWGINLKWGSPINNVNVVRRSSTPHPFLHGEPVALHVDSGGYLRYGQRTWGINLEWSSTPVYEWYILGEGVPGGPMGDGKKALWNKAAGDFMIYGERSFGINLRWYQDTLPKPPEPPPSGPNGISALHVFNCTIDRRPLKMWVQDITAGTPISEVATLSQQYSGPSCPAGSPPWVFSPIQGHIYFLRALDWTAPGCANMPDIGSCSKSDTTFRGDTTGPIASSTIS